MESFAVRGDDLLERIEHLAVQLGERLEDDDPAIVAVEDGYVGRNHRTSLTIGMARGVAAFVAKSSTSARVHLVDPGEARKAIGVARFAQSRAAAKSAVIVAVSQILCLTTSAPDDDEADAAALAIWAAGRLWQLEARIG
jgi:Holliday junction resolvasome RuvABC endonuclease subunit